MNCFGRTKSNKERLRLKSFFKRALYVFKFVEKEIIILKPDNLNIKGSGSSNTYNNRVYSRLYDLVQVGTEDYAHRIEQRFNKPILIGKIITIKDKQYKVIRKR